MKYRATRGISLGQIRQVLRAGDVIEFDGVMTRIAGQNYAIPTMATIVNQGWLVLTEEETLPAVAPPAATPAAPPPAPTVEDSRIPFASEEARKADGKRPEAGKEHVWSTSWESDGSKTCRVCGATMQSNLIRADRTRGDGSQQFHYVDAYGNAITSLEELSCPVYLGDPGSAAALAKEHVRRVRGRVDAVEGHLESVDGRLARLEADNDFLRRRILDQPVLDASMVADALLIIAARARPDGDRTLVERVRALLPAPAFDLEVLEPVLEAVPVVAKDDDDPTSG